MKIIKNYQVVFIFAILTLISSTAYAQIKVDVDATDAARNVLHVKETLTAKAGAFTLFYPKWIPGEHAPTGPINNMVNLFITANGKPVQWQRDDVEMFAFHIVVPPDARQIEIAFDDVSQPATTMSANLARIKWNRLLLYPEGAKGDDVKVTGSLKMPVDWKYATALNVANETANNVAFKEVTLNAFVDSPAVIGKFFKKVPLVNANGAAHEIDIFADTQEALEYKPETLEGWNNLVKEANLMFDARHYNKYAFLLTLSDVGGSEGLEHHESSEDGVGEKSLSDKYRLIDLGDLLGHEYAHSWNGKYRRPIGLTTGDFETPQRAELLWVYEGLTQYLGTILPARSKLWTPETFREVVASDYAEMDVQTGRRWRPVVDTARAVQYTYDSPRAWRNSRRRVDYYVEGALMWLEIDVLIRQKSNGKLSLDDFMKKFHGGQNSAPMVKSYDIEEVVKTLNATLPYDWRGFLNQKIYQINEHAPSGGITNGGWKVVYNDTPNEYMQVGANIGGSANMLYSIGFLVNKDGVVSDVNQDLSTAKAGFAPGIKITTINGQAFSIENLHTIIAASKTATVPIVFGTENGGFKQTFTVNYTGGERYPHLERDATKTDLLSDVIKSH